MINFKVSCRLKILAQENKLTIISPTLFLIVKLHTNFFNLFANVKAQLSSSI